MQCETEVKLKMNSPGASSSPKYKNLKINTRNSPVELKEKMRKNYKNKVQNCRDMLINRFRGTLKESDLHNTLSEIYKDMFDFTDVIFIDEEEIKVLEEIKKELVQEEFQWWLEEYEKSQTDIDWSSLEQEDNVICPVCQKTNFTYKNNELSCLICNYTIKTPYNLVEIKNLIANSLEKHSAECNREVQFALMPEINESHIYLICSECTEMKIVV